MWGGSAEVGGRGTNIDGANRNGAYGNTAPLSATNPLTPFVGPADDAKAQEYQNINSAPIGVIDIRGGSRAYYLRAFGEEFGRDDQFINIVGGSFGAWKASFYNNDIPHNYSFNALSPLTNVGSTLLGFSSPSGTYPPAAESERWGTWNYGTQRNTTGGNFEVSMKSPWFVRADYNEVRTNGIKPASGQLGTGSGNGFIEFGAPADYKTQNTVIEGGYNSRQYGLKLAYIQSKFTDANDFMQWPNFYMRNGLDTTLLPPDNELKKWSLNGYWKQLPWDSAIIARYSQSKLTNSVGLTSAAWTSSLKPTSNVASPQGNPPGVGYLFTQPFDSCDEPEPDELRRRQQEDDRQRRLEREPDGAARHAGLLRLLQTGEQFDDRLVQARQPGQQLRDPARDQRDVLPDPGADRGERRGVLLHQERGRVRCRPGHSTAATSCSADSTGSASSATGRSTTRRCPSPTTTATGSSTRTPAAGTT